MYVCRAINEVLLLGHELSTPELSGQDGGGS